MGRNLMFLILVMLLNSREAASQADFRARADSSVKISPSYPVPQKFYNTPLPIRFRQSHSRLGYFCQKELELQKITRLPLFIRLGSKDQVDWMEGKKRLLLK